MHYQINALPVTSCEIDTFCCNYPVFAEDKCRKLTLFKNQVLNDSEQKEKDNNSPVKLKSRKIHVYVCFVVLFVFYGGEKWLLHAYCGKESI